MTEPNAKIELDAVVVGAGFAGLYTLHKLRGLGLRVKVLEAGKGVGGTWFWNRYPGARCDVESLEYSYSFSEALQQEWNWPERFSAQPDILRYANHVADRLDLRRDILTERRVASATFDDRTHCWTVRTAGGEVFEAPFCIMATGNLSLPRVPDFPGLKTFKGEWYHSGLWPEEGVDFTGRRVGVIGTGSSGVQMIPMIAEQAAHLFVFQRTANFSVPGVNRPMTPDVEHGHKARYAYWRDEAKRTPFGIAGHPPPSKTALEDTPEARAEVYERKWGTGGNISFLYAYKDLLTDKAANDTACEFVREKIRSTVRDPDVARLLMPNDHPIGTKRLCLDNGYFETFNRDNVTLVDVRSDPIVEITERGLRTKTCEYELDAVAFATGFDAMTGALLDIDIRGAGGLRLADKWAHGPRTYLGLMTAGLPNLFMITGPGSPSVKTNMIASIEQHVDWIANCVAHLRREGIRLIEADVAAEDAWVEHVNQVADSTLYPLANSWYVGANIPGKPRVFMPYVAGLDKYRMICDAVATESYRGFKLAEA
ncbi:cyclohexanone monooxygenase [Methylobacterium brachiatum]|uniref:Cyclohexanone monooxygenase n=1 Tax=Methylobacterium brachiatum TaxID=269660 RepID=A0AAJ1TTK7_9HYPH|nr:NAD(P)/FAD-dependent oxidoreductase [Methylobacterium brachiatum]MCB4806166.1 NAD(P)/FAD-dependent oxidoreductase [Methylobacterium brachiatum]MDQ0546620.1 cyclohexanone monooxygenase [Methylobacterium brachiatum]